MYYCSCGGLSSSLLTYQMMDIVLDHTYLFSSHLMQLEASLAALVMGCAIISVADAYQAKH